MKNKKPSPNEEGLILTKNKFYLSKKTDMFNNPAPELWLPIDDALEPSEVDVVVVVVPPEITVIVVVLFPVLEDAKPHPNSAPIENQSVKK